MNYLRKSMNRECYVYGLYNKQECKIRYIGITVTPERRLWHHLNRCTHKETYKDNWILKHNKDINLKVLFKGTVKECAKKEYELILKYKNKNKLTNLVNGGLFHPFYNLDEESYNIITQKISKSCIGRKLSKETKDKMSQTHKKRDLTYLTNFTKGVSNPRAFKVKQLDKEGNLIKIWDYCNEATQALNLDYTGICNCLKNRQKTCGGFKWEKL